MEALRHLTKVTGQFVLEIGTNIMAMCSLAVWEVCKKSRQEWQVAGSDGNTGVAYGRFNTHFYHQSRGCTASRSSAFVNTSFLSLSLSLPWLFVKFAILMLCMRVGEALNPGPPGELFHIGTVNPTGLLGKGEVVSHLPQGALGITDTHLTIPGVCGFRSELSFADSHLVSISGFPSWSYFLFFQGLSWGCFTFYVHLNSGCTWLAMDQAMYRISERREFPLF